MSPRPILIVGLALFLSACGTTRPVMVQAWPPAPVADLNAPLPSRSILPKDAKLSDVAAAHLKDSAGFLALKREVETWRQFWKDQAAAMR